MVSFSRIFTALTMLLFVCITLFPRGNSEKTDHSLPEPVTFTVFFADINLNWDNMESDVGRYIREKTGVTLDMKMAEGDQEEQINLIAASGNFPDMISPKGTTGTLIQAGALLDLTDLIEKHAPNIKAILGDKIGRLRYSNEDPSIYFIPNLETLNNEIYSAGGVFSLQLDVLQKLGYPRIRTVKDFEEAIKAYKEMYPFIDGRETIGLSLLADDWRILISTTNPAFYTTGAPDNGEFYIDPESYEVMLHYRRPPEREYFRWLNHMNDIGLLDPESFVQKWDQYIDKIASGRALALIDQTWEVSQGEDALKAEGKFERTYGRFPVTLSQEYETTVTFPQGFSGGWGMGITTACKDPVRAIEFLDFLASEEGQILVNWGIEGKHYVYENGRRTLLPEYAEMNRNDQNKFKRLTGIGNYQISLRYGDGNLDSTGNYFTMNFPEQILANYSDLEKEILSKYGASCWKDLFPPDEDFDPSPWGTAWSIPIPNDSPLSVFQEKEQSIVRRRIPEAILSDPSEFDRIYDLMLSEFDSTGADEMEQLYSEYVKARVRLWTRE